MMERLFDRLPEAWREIAELATAPIAWVPRLQLAVLEFFLESPSPSVAAAKYVFLVFPALLGLVAVWCTQLSLFTLPFRSARTRYVSLLLLAWWDAARMVWMYWAGLVRLAVVLIGWALVLAQFAVRLGAALVRHAGAAPLAAAGRATRTYVGPGLPGVALVLLALWCALEAAVFTTALGPTVTDTLLDLVGGEEAPRGTGPVLYLMLMLLVLGSFACVQALVDAVRTRDHTFVGQIVLVQLFVVGFEVMFLYRELADGMTPWIAQATGLRPGAAATLALAAGGWIGVRSLTWFLFGRYGTPPLLALIARQPRAVAAAPAEIAAAVPARLWWRPSAEALRSELAWLHERSEALLEYLALPALHVLAAALNFAMILTAARPAFNLPFRGLKEATEARDGLAMADLAARKQVSL